jgi:preprotein translocase subunit SecA
LFKGDLPAQENQQIQEAKKCQQDDYQLSKDEIVSSEAANRGWTNPTKQVTETIVRDMPKSIATIT